MSSKIAVVEILGQPLKVRLSGDLDDKYLGELARYVEAKMVEIGKIIFIETDNRGCIVHTQEGDFRENLPISEYERRLAGYRFFRIHKCFLVNLDQIHEILPWHNNSLALRMFGFEEKPLPVGRKNTRGLKHALNL